MLQAVWGGQYGDESDYVLKSHSASERLSYGSGRF